MRKVIHLATVALPLLVWVLPSTAALALLAFGALAAVAVELARSRLRWVRTRFLARVGTLLRPHERRGIAGATYMAWAYLLVFILLPLPMAVAAMLYNSLGDATAALVGKRWGRHRTSWGKSWEGALAGFMIGAATALLVPGLPPAAAVVGALAAATVEFLPLPLNDNITVPLSGGFVAWAMSQLSAIGYQLSGIG